MGRYLTYVYIYILYDNVQITDYTLLNLVETPTKKEMHLELQGGEGFKLVTVRTAGNPQASHCLIDFPANF